MLSDDNRVHLLRKSGDAYRAVTSQVDWPTYHGQPGGNRYSTVDQINAGNVGRLAPRGSYNVGATSQLEVTPVVVGGIMYVTAVNECDALDAGTGRRIWQFKRPRTKGLAGDAASGINRGVAVAADRVFMVTDNAHVVALDRFTRRAAVGNRDGRLRGRTTAPRRAPLAVGNLVISGVSGGDEGIRGFLAAFDQSTGKEAWRFWTVPAPRRAGLRDLEGHGHRSRLRRHLADRHVRSPRSICSTGRPATPARITTAASARATTSIPTRSSRSIRKPAG